jgi:hypothetical protein
MCGAASHAAGRKASRSGRMALVAAAIAGAVGLSGCGWFGDDEPGEDISAFDVEVGQCFNPPDEVKAELSTLRALPCDVEHTQEAYAIVPYSTAEDGSTSADQAYPGSDVLTAYADSACAQRFAEYVGVPYTDSSLYFTYLLPSARGWESENDRSVVCFVTTTGEKLTSSVRDSKR